MLCRRVGGHMAPAVDGWQSFGGRAVAIAAREPCAGPCGCELVVAACG
jgi:hypothetical protein